MIEHPWIGEFAQFGIDVAAAQHGDRPTMPGPHPGRHPQGAVQGAGERHGKTGHIGAMFTDESIGEVVDPAVDQAASGMEGVIEIVERGGADGQLVGIAGQVETRVHAFTDGIHQVVEKQAGQVGCLILRTGCAEIMTDPPVSPGPGECLGQSGKHVESRSFREPLAGDNPVGEGGVAALEEPDNRFHRIFDGGAVGEQMEGGRVGRGAGAFQGTADLPHSLPGEEVERQRQGGIGQADIMVPVTMQEARQVRRRSIRGVHLHHRRYDQQYAHGHSHTMACPRSRGRRQARHVF